MAVGNTLAVPRTEGIAAGFVEPCIPTLAAKCSGSMMGFEGMHPDNPAMVRRRKSRWALCDLAARGNVAASSPGPDL